MANPFRLRKSGGGSTLRGGDTLRGADSGTTVTVPLATLTFTSFAPTVTATANVTVTVPVAALSLSTFAPTVQLPVVVVVPAMVDTELALTTFPPTVTVTAAVTVTVPVASLTLNTLAPIVSTPRLVTVPVATLTLATFAPTVTIAGSASITVPTANLILTTFAPSLPGIDVPPQYPTMSLLGVPLAVRLKSARADVFVSREVTDLTFGSAIPGGFSSASITLHRPLSGDPPELDTFTTMYVYDGRSGAVVWQGRLEDPGRASGNRGEVWRVNAVGPAAHARDRTVPIIYVDHMADRWAPYYGNYTTGTIAVIPASAVFIDWSLAANVSNGETATVGFVLGHQYNAIREAGQHIGRYSFGWDVGLTDTDWKVDTLTGAGNFANLEDNISFNTAGGSVSKVITTDFSNTTDMMALIIERITSNQNVAVDTVGATWNTLVVRGTIYTTAGTEDVTGATYSANTILASTVVRDLLGRLLPEFDGVNATIATTSYAITQLAYPDGVNAAQVLDDLALLEPGYFWAAWEDTSTGDALFEYTAWPTSIGIEASARDGFDSPGSASELYNAVTVRWRNVHRVRTTTRTNAVQVLTDAGLTRTAYIDLGDELSSTENADRAGDQFLLEHAAAPNAGTLTVQSPILSLSLGRMLQPWELVRHAPGKLIRVRDVKPRVDALNATSRDAVTIFKVVGAEYNARDNSCRLSLDSQPKTLTRLLSAPTKGRL